MKTPNPDLEMQRKCREAYARGEYQTHKELLNDIELRMFNEYWEEYIKNGNISPNLKEIAKEAFLAGIKAIRNTH